MPRSRVVTPKLEIMEKRIVELDNVINKLVRGLEGGPNVLSDIVQKQKQFRKLCTVVDNLETLVIEAQKTKGWEWVEKEPLWTTWSLNKFGT